MWHVYFLNSCVWALLAAYVLSYAVSCSVVERNQTFHIPRNFSNFSTKMELFWGSTSQKTQTVEEEICWPTSILWRSRILSCKVKVRGHMHTFLPDRGVWALQAAYQRPSSNKELCMCRVVAVRVHAVRSFVVAAAEYRVRVKHCCSFSSHWRENSACVCVCVWLCVCGCVCVCECVGTRTLCASYSVLR
jgi:hypothetical protein